MDELAPGTIIKAMHLAESFATASAASENWAVQRHDSVKMPSDPTRSISAKSRFFIVTKISQGLFEAVAIFTKSGRGIANVPELSGERENYMSIRDSSTNSDPQNGTVLEVLEWDADTALHERSIVLFKGPSTIYVHHPIRIIGRLTLGSTALLLCHIRKSEWEDVVEQPSPAMLQYLESRFASAKYAQEQFKESLALNPVLGLARNGNKPRLLLNTSQCMKRSTSMREKSGTLFTSARSPMLAGLLRSTLDSNASSHSPNQTPNLTPVTTPSRPLFSNSFEALSIESHDAVGGSSDVDDKTEQGHASGR